MPSRRSGRPRAGGANGRPSCTLTRATTYPRCRSALASRRIRVRIARNGINSSQRLGRHRWVVERTLAWLTRNRRLTVRYKRRADIHQAFLTRGCALICFKALPWPF